MNYKVVDTVQASKLKVGDVIDIETNEYWLGVVEAVTTTIIRVAIIDKSDTNARLGHMDFTKYVKLPLTNLKLAFVERDK